MVQGMSITETTPPPSDVATIEELETTERRAEDPSTNPGPRGNPSFDQAEVDKGLEKLASIVGN